jgi:hypothetical protein
MAANLGAQFLRLLPSSPLLVATVVSSSGGLAVVELPGGARLTVRGTAAVASRVFVRAGAIEGAAPAVSAVQTIDV